MIETITITLDGAISEEQLEDMEIAIKVAIQNAEGVNTYVLNIEGE